MAEDFLAFLKWIILGVFLGVVIGFVGAMFNICLTWAASFRADNTWIYYFLPAGGILVVWLYKTFGSENDRGTNSALEEADMGII